MKKITEMRVAKIVQNGIKRGKTVILVNKRKQNERCDRNQKMSFFMMFVTKESFFSYISVIVRKR